MAGSKGRSGGNHMTKSAPPTTSSRPPTKPRGLSKRASYFWDSILKLTPKNVLSPIDGFEVKFLANLLARAEFLENKLKGDPADAKSHRLYLQTFKEVHRLSACFGLNPADRARLNLNAEDDAPDPFLEFLELSRKANNSAI